MPASCIYATQLAIHGIAMYRRNLHHGYMRAAPFLLLLIAAPASAHIELTYPPPRSAAMKSAPCGAAGSTRSARATTFAPGETITVEWNEIIPHPGHYRISFD